MKMSLHYTYNTVNSFSGHGVDTCIVTCNSSSVANFRILYSSGKTLSPFPALDALAVS